MIVPQSFLHKLYNRYCLKETDSAIRIQFLDKAVRVHYWDIPTAPIPTGHHSC